MKDLLLWAPVVVRTSNLTISRRRLADYVKRLHKVRAARAARLFSVIRPIILLVYDVIVAVAVAVS